jgi:hypothetical protein
MSRKNVPSQKPFVEKLIGALEGELQATIAIGLLLAFVIGTSMAAEPQAVPTSTQTATSTDTITTTLNSGISSGQTSAKVGTKTYTGLTLGTARHASFYGLNPSSWSKAILQGTNYIYNIKSEATSTSLPLSEPFTGSITVIPTTNNNKAFEVTINGKKVAVTNAPISINLSNASQLDITVNGLYSLAGFTFDSSTPSWAGSSLSAPEGTTTEPTSEILSQPVTLQALPSSVRVEVTKSSQIIVVTTNALNKVISSPLTWTTSDPSIATVSETGVVKGLSIGSATITVSVKDNPKLKASVTITVTNAAGLRVNLSRSAVVVTDGDTATVTVSTEAVENYSATRTVRVLADFPANVSAKISQSDVKVGDSTVISFATKFGNTEPKKYDIPVTVFDGLNAFTANFTLLVNPAPASATAQSANAAQPDSAKYYQDQDSAKAPELDKVKTYPWYGDVDSAKIGDALVAAKTQINLGQTSLSTEVKSFITAKALTTATQAEIKQSLNDQGVKGIAATVQTVKLNVEKFASDVRSMLGLNTSVAAKAKVEVVTQLSAPQQQAVSQILTPAAHPTTIGTAVSNAARNIGTTVRDLVLGNRGGGNGAGATDSSVLDPGGDLK